VEARRHALDHAGLQRGEGMALHEPRAGGCVLALQHLLRQRFGRAQARRQRADHGFAKRPLVIAGKKAHQREPIRWKARRIVAPRGNRPDARDVELRSDVVLDHHADFLLRAEADRDAIAGARFDFFGQRIFEKRCERHVERDADARNFPCRQGLRVCG
jgi:hypothetical protein